ncbi:MAG TPA: type II toxin-antitoxin system HigB family toxin [Ignavibacteria bacterium]|nr:type II toxin-antitoxin system HigB family toxin [Ignavibacteria bacterium]
MKTHLIKKQTIEEYVKSNSQSKSAFSLWLSILKWVQWKEPNDIISTFNSADILGKSSKRVVFNIGGNKYRMICSYHFGKKRVHLFVKWIGTHSEYTKLCNEGKQYTVNVY